MTVTEKRSDQGAADASPPSDAPGIVQRAQAEVEREAHAVAGRLRHRGEHYALGAQFVASTLFRLLVLVFLRVIPGGIGFLSVYAYAAYVAAWVAYDVYLYRHLGDKRSYADAAKHGSSDSDLVARLAQSRPAQYALSIALGISTRCRRVNLCVLSVQTLLLLLFLDLYYSPFMFPSHLDYNLRFARVGALSPSTATLHLRFPHPLPPLDGLWEGDGIEDSPGVLTDAEALSAAPVRVVWRRVVEGSAGAGGAGAPPPQRAHGAASALRDARRWERGPLVPLSAESDWTASVTLTDLWPATRYEWRLAFVHNNTFAPVPERPVQFVTWPDPRLSAYLKTKHADAAPASSADERSPVDDPNHFTFAATSCIKADFPYNPAQFWGWNWLLKLLGIGTGPGGVAQRNRIRGFDLMAQRHVDGAGATPGLRFLLELGDLIYADVPRYEGPYLSSYRKLYRNLFASESFRRVYNKIPVLGIYDDHEIVNNWSGGGYGDEASQVDRHMLHEFERHPSPPAGLGPGIIAWAEYMGNANPAPAARGEHYYSFQYGDTAFFVMDVRAHRTHAGYKGDDRTTLGASQRAALLNWLTQVNHTATFKFLVSSVPFTSLWGGPLDLDGRLDGWAAYPEERKLVLDVLQYVPNVIIISGDRHEFASSLMRNSVVEFSTSPLSMFYIPIRTLSQSHTIEPGHETLLKYLPDGNYKWSEFEVDTRDPHAPVVRVSVQIDGKEAWRVAVMGRPVSRPRGALGSLAKSLVELLGFRPRRWFG